MKSGMRIETLKSPTKRTTSWLGTKRVLSRHPTYEKSFNREFAKSSRFTPCSLQERRKNIQRCLRSVNWVDEAFVVDSQSTDRTISIAEQESAQVVQFNYRGGWPKKKNWALDNLPFKNEWVLILDADECLPPEAEGGNTEDH